MTTMERGYKGCCSTYNLPLLTHDGKRIINMYGLIHFSFRLMEEIRAIYHVSISMVLGDFLSFDNLGLWGS
jgi:hypothetical protein